MAQGSSLIAALRSASPASEAQAQGPMFQSFAFPWQQNSTAPSVSSFTAPVPKVATGPTISALRDQRTESNQQQQSYTPDAYYQPYVWDNDYGWNLNNTALTAYPSYYTPPENQDPSYYSGQQYGTPAWQDTYSGTQEDYYHPENSSYYVGPSYQQQSYTAPTYEQPSETIYTASQQNYVDPIPEPTIDYNQPQNANQDWWYYNDYYEPQDLANFQQSYQQPSYEPSYYPIYSEPAYEPAPEQNYYNNYDQAPQYVWDNDYGWVLP